MLEKLKSVWSVSCHENTKHKFCLSYWDCVISRKKEGINIRFLGYLIWLRWENSIFLSLYYSCNICVILRDMRSQNSWFLGQVFKGSTASFATVYCGLNLFGQNFFICNMEPWIRWWRKFCLWNSLRWPGLEHGENGWPNLW